MDLRSVSIASRRLLLTASAPADAAETFAAITPAITRWMAFEPSPSLAAAAEVYAGWLPQMAAGTDLHATIRLAGTGELLGRIGLHHLETTAVETGIWIKEAAQGKGYGREAVAALLDWAARTLGVASAAYAVVETNWPSRRLAESLGGTVVGTRTLAKPGGIEHPEVVYRVPVPPTA